MIPAPPTTHPIHESAVRAAERIVGITQGAITVSNPKKAVGGNKNVKYSGSEMAAFTVMTPK